MSTQFIYAIYALRTLIEGDHIDDDGEFDASAIVAQYDDLAGAQNHAATLKGDDFKVFAFLPDTEILDPSVSGIEVTHASEPPAIIDPSVAPTLCASLPLYPDLPSEFSDVDAALLPLLGFCGTRPVSIREDRTGYVGR